MVDVAAVAFEDGLAAGWAEVSREGSWPFDDHDVVLADLRHPVSEEDLRWAFAVMAEVATELRIAPLPDTVAVEHAGTAEFDAVLARPRWSSLG